MKIKTIIISITFLLFLIQFKLYDEWNSKQQNLEFAGIRYSSSVNGNNINKLLFLETKNCYFLTNAATDLTTSLINIMEIVGLSDSEKKMYLKNLEKFADNKLNGIKAFESFEKEYNIAVDKFNKNEYEPRLSKLRSNKNYSAYVIIIIALILAILNIIQERKTKTSL
ncbi:hypothetical protein [Marinifilum fragile]|uniref:hypothetical protein n=1 Tax=Marinifilum fragile TaxID=570161 RepID=UPI002AA84FB7|nr:hypothetical protein [Marinifilum fragile]